MIAQDKWHQMLSHISIESFMNIIDKSITAKRDNHVLIGNLSCQLS